MQDVGGWRIRDVTSAQTSHAVVDAAERVAGLQQQRGRPGQPGTMIASLTRIRLGFTVLSSLPGASRLALFRSSAAAFRAGLVSAAVLAACASRGASRLAAQSLTSGVVTGTVRDSMQRRVDGASVTLIDLVTGLRQVQATRRAGVYRFGLAFPGDYDLLVERFGYRPKLIRRVPIRAGVELVVDVSVELGAPDVAVDTSIFAGSPPDGLRLALRPGDAVDDFAALSDELALFTTAGRLLPGADGQLGAAGLPGRLSQSSVDGVVRTAPRHSRLPDATLDGAAFPLRALRGVELTGGADVELPGVGGGMLTATTVPGVRAFGASLAAAGGPNGGSGSLVVSGPIVPDTAFFSLGVSAQQVARRLPSPWMADSLSAQAGSIALDSFQTDLSAYQNPFSATTKVVSGFGRFDGLIARGQRLSIRAEGSSATVDDPILGSAVPVALGSRLTAKDLSAGALLASSLGMTFGNELRLSVDIGTRDYTSTGLPGTTFTDGGYAAGSADVQPGVFKRSTVRVGDAAYLRFGPITFKVGGQAAFSTYDETYVDGRSGQYAFGDSTGFALRSGAFRQTVGALPFARFSTQAWAAFGQMMLYVAPGFDVIAGVRWETEAWPVSQITANTAWRQATGVNNTAVRSSRSMLQPRLGFNWALGASRRWQVRGDATLSADPLDPGVMAEAITHARGALVRRGFGLLGAWPRVPDSTAASVRGQALTLLGPDFTPPRTARLLFGISERGAGTTLRIQGDYRHTDFLPLRRDMNLRSNPRARDQYGRPLHGALTKSGTLVAAVPGSNRPFSGFDEVSTLDPAGASDYLGVTLGVERAVSRGFNLLAHYTYARTRDNWFGARGDGAEAQFVPFADSTGRSTWIKGRSDFDVPHRLVLGGEVQIGDPRLGLRLAALYRWSSGYPFTPGFRDGVDANGDGSGRNDPAFVTTDSAVQGAANLIAQTGCLLAQVGRFVDRNACRDPSASALDLRLAATIGHFGRSTAELILDGFGVVRSGDDVYDHALYLVDGAAPLVTNAATGVTSVPLTANPNFGRVLSRRSPGVAWRAGIRVDF
jgi:hypothetical protein